jgi:hypothetical protein
MRRDPRAGAQFLVELTGAPPCVAEGEEVTLGPVSTRDALEQFARCADPDAVSHQNAVEASCRVVSFVDQPTGLWGHRSTVEHSCLGVTRRYGKIQLFQHGTERHVFERAVDDEAERTVAVVLDEQDHGADEVRVAQGRRGDEKSGGDLRSHRFSLSRTIESASADAKRFGGVRRRVSTRRRA